MKELKSKSLLIYDPETGEKKEIDIFRGESAYEAAVRLGMTTLSEEQWVKEYEANRDAAIAAIEAKAKEALASIPEDYTQLNERVEQLSEEIGYFPITNMLYGAANERSHKTVTVATSEYEPSDKSKAVPLFANHKYLVYYSILIGENASGWPSGAIFYPYLRNVKTNSNITGVSQVVHKTFGNNWATGDRRTFYAYFSATTDYESVGGWYCVINAGTNEKYADWINDKVYLLDVTGMSEVECSAIIERLSVVSGNVKGIPGDTKIVTMDRRITNLEAGRPVDHDLLFWGDSLTAGAGGDGISYPSVCADELSMDYNNCGVGGETANTISARQGGNSILIPVGAVNRTYSKDELVDVFGVPVHPLRQGDGKGSGNVLYINGQKCNLTMSQSTSTSNDLVYTISGYTGNALTVPAFAKFAGSDFTGKIVCIWVGANGAKVGDDTSVNAKIAIIDSMIAHLGHSNYVILAAWRAGATESSLAEDDAAMLKRYGNKFFPARKMLVNYGLAMMGITPSTQDNTDVANGAIPTSLRSDGVHLNAHGYTALGKMLADKIRSLGYV